MATTTLTIKKLKHILESQLNLKDPEFRLEKLPSGRIYGSVISPTFFKRSDIQRQKMMWKALEKEYGQDWARMVGGLLAYTPDEWNVDLEGFKKQKKMPLKRLG